MNEDERDDLQKYPFYLERYMNNAQAIESVNKLMKALKSEEEDLSNDLSLTLTQVEFLQNACQVLRNAKRTLKWSYAYMFHLNNELQRNLYEVIQENLDMHSSELHVLLEKEYPIAKTNIKDFTIFKEKVMAAMFKCNRSLETFLEKMEEFETIVLEEQMEKIEAEKRESKFKMRNTAKRMASNVSTDSESGHETQRVKRSAFQFV